VKRDNSTGHLRIGMNTTIFCYDKFHPIDFMKKTISKRDTIGALSFPIQVDEYKKIK